MLEGRQQEAQDSVVFSDLEAVVSMTPSQIEIWATCSNSDQATCAYNNVINISIEGKLNKKALEFAIDALVQRYQSLRASFHGNTQTMCIAKKLDIPILEIDLSTTHQTEIQQKLFDIELQEVSTPFDLNYGPALRLNLVKTSDNTYQFFMSTHQMCIDHWSVDLLATELAELYSSAVEARAPKLPKAFSSTEHALWLSNPANVKRRCENREYWLSKLAKSASSPVNSFATRKCSERSYSATRVDREIRPELAKQIASTAAKEKSTFFGFALAIFSVLLSRLKKGHEVNIAIPAAGQLDVGQNRMASACINTLPLLIKLENDLSFRDSLAVVRKEMYAAQSYTPFTYTEILHDIETPENSGRLPLVSVMFNVDQEKHHLGFSGLHASYVIVPRVFEKFEISMTIVHYGNETSLQCYFNDDLFSENDRSNFVDAYISLLQESVENSGKNIFSDLFNENFSCLDHGHLNYFGESRLTDSIPMTKPDSQEIDQASSIVSAKKQIDSILTEFDLMINQKISRFKHQSQNIELSEVPTVTKLVQKATSQESLYFGKNKELYGIYRPSLGDASGVKVGVLFCGPHGTDYVRSHRFIRSMSVAIQKIGIPSLKFDYYGVGDSFGSSEESALSLWSENIFLAHQELVEKSGCQNVIGIGVRIGANLLMTSDMKQKFSNLALIDPIIDGEQEINSWLKKHRGMLRDNNKYRFGRANITYDDMVEMAGFCFSKRMLAQISEIKLDESDFRLERSSLILMLEEFNRKWAAQHSIVYPDITEQPEWNNPVRMSDPIMSPQLVAAVREFVAQVDARQ